MAITGPAEASGTTEAKASSRRRPGFRRLGFGGFLLALVGALSAWSLLLALLGIGAFDFSAGVQIASHPGPFVLNGVALSLPVAVLVVGPLAVVGVIGGGSVWLGGPPRLALAACLVWMAAGLLLLAVGGTPGFLAFALLAFALILSGAWAGRSPTSTLRDLFLADTY